MQDTSKAFSSDIESLQKICRNLRSDIEMLPIIDMSPPGESEHGPVPVNPDCTVALSEIQNRLQRKADTDTVDHLIRSTAQAKEGLEKMKLVVDELKQQMRSAAPSASRRASSTIMQAPMTEVTLDSQKEMEVDPKIISEIIIEEKATQMAGKADCKDLNGLQIQMTLLEEQHHPNNLSFSLATLSPDGVLMETSPGQEIKETKQEQNNSNEEKDKKLSDQLVEQRIDHTELQQVLQQEKSIPDTIPSSEFQKLKSTYAALQFSLQKLQELISQKADRDELLQLHQSVYRQKSEFPVPQLVPQLPPMLPHQLTPSGGRNFENEGEQPSRYITAAEKVEKHEMLLNKLLKDMELLGTGVLTLSGHNHGDTKDSKMQQDCPGAEVLESKDPHLRALLLLLP